MTILGNWNRFRSGFVGCRIDRSVRFRSAAVGHIPVFGADLGRGSGGRAGRFRGDSRQRSPVHRRLWRIAAQRCRHSRKFGGENETGLRF